LESHVIRGVHFNWISHISITTSTSGYKKPDKVDFDCRSPYLFFFSCINLQKSEPKPFQDLDASYYFSRKPEEEVLWSFALSSS
jgi:hypothetical protein